MNELGQAVRDALLTPDPRAKVMATRALVRAWRSGRLTPRFTMPMPERPAWPAGLDLRPARDMPRRGRGGSDSNRVALWHSIAHIEFVAIDLALDMAGRFGGEMGAGADFVSDFLSVAADEAMHFALINRHLAQLGSFYGALPVHDGLWEASHATRHDVAARLAIVPMVLEARGLDVTPATILRVHGQGDERGARILERILVDEIRHVRTGVTHFETVAQSRGLDPRTCWTAMVNAHFGGSLKAPFNDSARCAGGLPRDFYAALA